RLVERLHRRGAGHSRYSLEIGLARRMVREAHEPGVVTLVGDVDVMRGVGSPHVQGGRRALRPDHAEVREELLHHGAARRPPAPIRVAATVHPSHAFLLCLGAPSNRRSPGIVSRPGLTNRSEAPTVRPRAPSIFSSTHTKELPMTAKKKGTALLMVWT